MAGISSRASNALENKLHKFNGWEKNDDLDLNVYESFYRTFDYTTNRSWQQDPKIEDGDMGMSPYAMMSDNPVNRTDPMGDIDWQQLVAQMWRQAGISSSTTPAEFGNTMKEVAKDPKVWVQGFQPMLVFPNSQERRLAPPVPSFGVFTNDYHTQRRLSYVEVCSLFSPGWCSLPADVGVPK